MRLIFQTSSGGILCKLSLPLDGGTTKPFLLHSEICDAPEQNIKANGKNKIATGFVPLP
jgi:hypothetical protein